ncbi:hypothetical protein MY11210_005897 [Beauveria gryllotalpidicola]
MASTDSEREQDNFSSVSWSEHPDGAAAARLPPQTSNAEGGAAPSTGKVGLPHDAAGDSHILDCTVGTPLKENDGSKDAFVSYLITTHSTFPSFQREDTNVRRRFTDFLFLSKQLMRDFPATAVPPLPDKQRMEYVRGDRFGSDFTSRRAHSLQRFLIRLSLHPVLRRAPILHSFLESPDWNATVRSRTTRSSIHSDPNGSSGVFDNFADTFINAFTKVHRPDKRFIEVKDRSDKLDEDLNHIEKVVARVVRRESDLEADMRDLAEQFQKLITLEPGVEPAAHAFAVSIEDMAASLRTLKDVTDQDYLGSLRDLQAYSFALKNLLRAREQKQLDFEQLTEYLNKSTTERDQLHTGHATSGPGGFLRAKLEDVRGVDHEQARRERTRKLELRVEELTHEVENARRTSDLFDDEVVRETADFERIKRIEMKSQLAGLADAHVAFYGSVIDTWEAYIQEMDREGLVAA